MYKKILLVSTVCFAFFLLADGNAAENLSIDGYDWQKRSTSSKISFVEGWLMCGNSVYDNTLIDFEELLVGRDKAGGRNEWTKWQLEIYKDAGALLGGVTIGQIIDIIDKIYSDARVTTMDITEVMPFVSGRLIKGWTESELDEVIALNVRLKQCKGKGKDYLGTCGPIRIELNSYLQKLKKR